MVNYAVLPQRGEDSFALSNSTDNCMLCVADGCGGLGSKRYADLNDQTGAYMASRLVARFISHWAKTAPALPATPDEGRERLTLLENQLHDLLLGFASRNSMIEYGGRIVGSMQRTLPSTLCTALMKRANDEDVCHFIWVGDSRGYTLDGDGLRQYTQDDLRGQPDAFDCLSCDSPLSSCLSADRPIHLHLRRISLSRPSIILCATDGVFGCLPTPMEFEMLLLSTMQAASDEQTWQRKLLAALKKLATDDATLLMRPHGFESYEAMKTYFAPRLEHLKATWILPVRRNGQDRAFARSKWLDYRTAYDCTEGKPDDQNDWRI